MDPISGNNTCPLCRAVYFFDVPDEETLQGLLALNSIIDWHLERLTHFTEEFITESRRIKVKVVDRTVEVAMRKLIQVGDSIRPCLNISN